jgi:hypothetical protein
MEFIPVLDNAAALVQQLKEHNSSFYRDAR